MFFLFFFFNDTATTEIYTLSLHDALPILCVRRHVYVDGHCEEERHHDRRLRAPSCGSRRARRPGDSRCEHGSFPADSDRKSTRLNSSHGYISYAVFCLKKKKKKELILSTT